MLISATKARDIRTTASGRAGFIEWLGKQIVEAAENVGGPQKVWLEVDEQGSVEWDNDIPDNEYSPNCTYLVECVLRPAGYNSERSGSELVISW